MRLIVTGGRDYEDWIAIFAALDRAHKKRPITMLVHGDCPTGADAHAKEWAGLRGVPHEPHPADWAGHGNAAGPIRNSEMVALGADGCIVFPGGDGTADCEEKARRAGIKIWRPAG